jgi:hypothetical protein
VKIRKKKKVGEKRKKCKKEINSFLFLKLYWSNYYWVVGYIAMRNEME